LARPIYCKVWTKYILYWSTDYHKYTNVARCRLVQEVLQWKTGWPLHCNSGAKAVARCKGCFKMQVMPVEMVDEVLQ
jgi:hypothetical protein